MSIIHTSHRVVIVFKIVSRLETSRENLPFVDTKSGRGAPVLVTFFPAQQVIDYYLSRENADGDFDRHLWQNFRLTPASYAFASSACDENTYIL